MEVVITVEDDIAFKMTYPLKMTYRLRLDKIVKMSRLCLSLSLITIISRS